ncbi:heat shock factor protein 1 isoform X2 [Hyperolius riggenbachi]|uniref:heat shock factor protein 1 isoform X2 n=1 Tax=Hyperolius riggenbachi TaxID=752182 RepID=UPI0035A33829
MMDTHSTTGGSNVPAFLAKLWTLVEDPDTDPLICWSPEGTSFHVFDQGCFAKEVLPKYFKHNNMASFVRQLNMYGFRKVVHIEQGGLLKPEKDDTEFQHPYFIRGHEHLLENIKRKVNNLSGAKTEDVKVRQDNVGKLLTDIQVMKGKQESMDCRLLAMKHENESLWREVASLRQKHAQQQKVVNKLIQFLISLVQSNRILGVKRKIPLMLNDSSTAHSLPKYSRQYSLEHVNGTAAFPATFSGYTDASRFSSDTSEGPIISDVTEQSSPSVSPSHSQEGSPVILIKEEPSSPGSPVISERSPMSQESVDSLLSPSTFIDSLLQDEPSEGTGNTKDGGAAQAEASEPCLSVARLDKHDLNDHVDVIDSGLDSLQNIFNTHSFSMDSSTLLDLFSPTLTGSDLPDLDSSLASIQELLSSQDQKETDPDPADAGKQIVHYTAQPLILMNTSGTELPILLELEEEDPAADYSEDPTLSLLSWGTQNKSGGSGVS